MDKKREPKIAGNDNAVRPNAAPAKYDDELEEGLEETFPASDPPAATQPVHHAPHPKKH